jgi:hypothetical protein
MRETALNNFYVSPTVTTVASLYEPYKGEYYLIGPTLPNHKPAHFQPGFEYRFVECDGDYPAPSGYYNIDFSYILIPPILSIGRDEADYSIITHPNHTAILIKDPLLGEQPRKCYDNNNKAPIGGTVIKFIDNVFNANVTITTQDSTSINNPDLINDLPQGLYKVEKNYEDGSKEETVIQKEN